MRQAQASQDLSAVYNQPKYLQSNHGECAELFYYIVLENTELFCNLQVVKYRLVLSKHANPVLINFSQ